MTQMNLSTYELLEWVPVLGENTPIYKKVQGIEGPFTILYFQNGDVAIHVQAIGMSTTDMLAVISDLQTK